MPRTVAAHHNERVTRDTLTFHRTRSRLHPQGGEGDDTAAPDRPLCRHRRVPDRGVVPWIPLLFEEWVGVVSDRVMRSSFDQFTSLPALDRIALEHGSS